MGDWANHHDISVTPRRYLQRQWKRNKPVSRCHSWYFIIRWIDLTRLHGLAPSTIRFAPGTASLPKSPFVRMCTMWLRQCVDPPLFVVRMDVNRGNETIRGKPAETTPTECTLEGSSHTEEVQTTSPENICKLYSVKCRSSHPSERANVFLNSVQRCAKYYGSLGSLSP